MKAAVIKEPGVIAVEEVPKPAPGPGEVLLKVEACAICGTDQRVLKGEKAVSVPIVGHEIVGIAEAVGEGVENIPLGARYAVQTVIGCGGCYWCVQHRENLCENGFTAIGYAYNGGFAEYMVMPAAGVRQGCLIEVPDGISVDVATLFEPLSCCVNGMRCMPLEEARHVIVFGGGIIGVLNALVAKARGAKRVAIVDIVAERLALLESMRLPIDTFVNSLEIDLGSWAKDWTGGLGADAVVAAASVKEIVPAGLALLGKSGHLSIFAGMPKSDPIEPLDLNLIHYPELHVHGANSSVRRDFEEARELLVSGRIDGAPLITHRFPLDDFNRAVAVQGDPSAGSLKVIIHPQAGSVS